MAFFTALKNDRDQLGRARDARKRVSKRHQRATTRKTSLRRCGAPKRSGGAFLDSCCLKSIVVYQEFPQWNNFDAVGKFSFFIPGYDDTFADIQLCSGSNQRCNFAFCSFWITKRPSGLDQHFFSTDSVERVKIHFLVVKGVVI